MKQGTTSASRAVLATEQNFMRGWYPCVNRLNEESLIFCRTTVRLIYIRLADYLVYCNVYLPEEKCLN